MVNTFHCFADLPPELRLKIWSFAIPDHTVPVAHFFHMCYSFDYLAYIPSITRDTAGKLRKTEPLPCPANSPLWSACYESRSVMLRTFPIAYGLTEPIHMQPDLFQWGGRASVKGSFIDYRSAASQLTLVPSRDLLILDAGHFTKILPWISAMSMTDPNWKLSHSFSLRPGMVPGDVVHLAFKLERSWTSLQHFDDWSLYRRLSIIIDAALYLYPKATLYFVDWGLRRRRRSEDGNWRPLPAGHKTFRVVGGRFVEAVDDGGWTYSFDFCKRNHWPGERHEQKKIAQGYQSPVMRFVKDLVRTALLAWESDSD